MLIAKLLRFKVMSGWAGGLLTLQEYMGPGAFQMSSFILPLNLLAEAFHLIRKFPMRISIAFAPISCVSWLTYKISLFIRKSCVSHCNPKLLHLFGD
jgi:hypothetical protein